MAGQQQQHPGGGFNPPDPTTKGGPDYGRFVDAVRKLQDHARAVDAPDEVITEAADLLEKVSSLLSPFDADEWESPSGRRMDLPMRGNVLTVPMSARKGEDGRIHGWARFARFHLGRNGAVHGGCLGMLFDTVLGLTSAVLTGGPYQRTAYLKVVPKHRADREGAAIRGGCRSGGRPQDLRVRPVERWRHPLDRGRGAVRAPQAWAALRWPDPDSIATIFTDQSPHTPLETDR